MMIFVADRINMKTLDEIDSEFVGNERMNYWTNFFYRGRRERDPITLNEIFSSHPETDSDNSLK